jgi:hypothetical protein
MSKQHPMASTHCKSLQIVAESAARGAERSMARTETNCCDAPFASRYQRKCKRKTRGNA